MLNITLNRNKVEKYSGCFGAISIWDMHSHIVPTTRWIATIPTSGDSEKTYSPKMDEVRIGNDIFQGISVDGLDAMNIYVTGWAGISFSTGLPPSPFFKTASVCFEPDSISAPSLPTKKPDLTLAHLGSPGYANLVSLKAEEVEFADSVKDNGNGEYSQTLYIPSPSDVNKIVLQIGFFKSQICINLGEKLRQQSIWVRLMNLFRSFFYDFLRIRRT